MGKQGKGILGGFSGKVGIIQGLRRFSRDTIQSLPTFKSRVLGFSFDKKNQVMIDTINCTAGEFFLQANPLITPWLTGAVCDLSMSDNKALLEWEINVPLGNVFGCIGKEIGNYHYANYAYNIYTLNLNYSIRNYGVNIIANIPFVLGTTFRIQASKNIVKYQVAPPGEKFSTVFSQVPIETGSLIGLFSIGGNNSRLDEIKAADTPGTWNRN